MNMDTVPAFGHMDEVEEFDAHEIEDWTLYIIRLDAFGETDVLRSISQRRCDTSLWSELQAVPLVDPQIRSPPSDSRCEACEDGWTMPYPYPGKGVTHAGAWRSPPGGYRMRAN